MLKPYEDMSLRFTIQFYSIIVQPMSLKVLVVSLKKTSGFWPFAFLFSSTSTETSHYVEKQNIESPHLTVGIQHKSKSKISFGFIFHFWVAPLQSLQNTNNLTIPQSAVMTLNRWWQQGHHITKAFGLWVLWYQRKNSDCLMIGNNHYFTGTSFENCCGHTNSSECEVV